jgi:hypothetical protein
LKFGPIFKELNSLKIGPNFILQHLKNKIIFNFVKFVTSKKFDNKFFSPLSFVDVFLDPGWVKIRIRDKHPGSATLEKGLTFFLWKSSPLQKEKILFLFLRQILSYQDSVSDHHQYSL